MDFKPKIIVIVGPTAAGKSIFALKVAEEFNCEIVNADSMQVYRYLDIGTAKPSREERERVPHHLIDIRDPDEDFDAAEFREEASKAINGIIKRNRVPVVVGGTGLYIKVLTEGIFEAPKADRGLREKLKKELDEYGISHLYDKLMEVDPSAALSIGPANTHRIIRALEFFYLTGEPISLYQGKHAFADRPYDTLKIGLMADREMLYKKIDFRVEGMIEKGLVDEVEHILKMGYQPDIKSLQAIGYNQICSFLSRHYSNLEDAICHIKRDTRRYAKRQMTWFRRDHEISWFDVSREGYLGDILCKVRGFACQA